MLDVLTLIKRTLDADHQYVETARNVFCGVRSVGMREYYESYAVDVHPDVKFVLADYLDYDGETLVEHNGQRYRVLRTYRTGQELELTCERAPVEDGGVRG